MSDRERPTGGRDSRRVTAPTERVSGTQPRVSGTQPRISGTHPRVSGTHPRVSGGGPTQTTPPPVRRKGRLIAMLALGVGVVVGVGLLLFAVWSDRDDEAGAPASGGKSAPADHQAAAAPNDSNVPPTVPPTVPLAAPGPTAASTPAPQPGQAPAPTPAGVAQATPAAPVPDAVARGGHARDGGAAPAAEARRASATGGASDKSKSSARPDAGAPASKREGQAQASQTPDGGVPARRGGESAGRRPREDDDDSQVRVARFVEAGGADLEGRVVNVDTGRPVPGISVDVRLEGRYVEVETGADGSFKAPGMVPGSKVLVWIGGRRDRMVAERFDVRIPDTGKKADLGLVRLLDGDELDSRLDGWIGLYVTRKDEKVRVSAVNAWVPANRAGIEVGDAVLSVDGRDIKGLGPRSVSFLLRGPSGSSTTLEVESGDGKRRKLTLKRVTR